jgi:Protein NO VEIN, C-terminal
MSEPKRRQLETVAIVVGYAMSRLDDRYLRSQGVRTWKTAFAHAAKALQVPPLTLKNLRDEFDAFHDNSRKGWWNRPIRTNRQRAMGDLSEVSDDALLECVNRILGRDERATKELLHSILESRPAAHNVAGRLLTGHRAENLFLTNCEAWTGIPRSQVIDRRYSALGFDFAVAGLPERAIEVKGLAGRSGAIQFTDREWSEAKVRKAEYWLVVIGNVTATPTFQIWKDPQRLLSVQCRYQRSVAAVWTSRVTLQS